MICSTNTKALPLTVLSVETAISCGSPEARGRAASAAPYLRTSPCVPARPSPSTRQWHMKLGDEKSDMSHTDTAPMPPSASGTPTRRTFSTSSVTLPKPHQPPMT